MLIIKIKLLDLIKQTWLSWRWRYTGFQCKVILMKQTQEQIEGLTVHLLKRG